MKRLDLGLLTDHIRSMKPYSRIFKVLKKELTALGYWRNHPRGNPQKGYQARMAKK